MRLTTRFILLFLCYAVFFLLAGSTLAETETTENAGNGGSRILKSLSLPMHIDPLDEGRAGAMHRGPNPHAKLTPEQQITVALQHFRDGRLPQAMAVLDQALAKNPQAAQLYNVRASLYLANDQTAQALADIEQAIKLMPEEPLYRVTRAQIYLKFERLDEAMTDLDKAVAINPDLIPARYNRGTLLAYQENYQPALVDFTHCIAIEPHLPAPYFNRGSVYYALGEKAKAREDIEHFIEMADVDSWKQSGVDLLKAWDVTAENHVPSSEADNKLEADQ